MTENNTMINAKQEPVVDRLVREGWRVNLVDADGTVYMSRRGGATRFGTIYCQVDPDGEVR